MALPPLKKGETKVDYARRMHWAGKKHIYIANKLGWTKKKVQETVIG